MLGPAIITRSIERSSIFDGFGNSWQYNSRSDRHSRIACWAIMFDLLQHCPLLRAHAESGTVGFGINHEMRVFKTNKKKKLDLVICTPREEEQKPGKKTPRTVTFATHAATCGITLTDEESHILSGLPLLKKVPVGTVLLALEAKATMTAHTKARPRLHDELDSSHSTVHGATDHAIAAGLLMVNVAPRFISNDQNKRAITPESATWNAAPQPEAAAGTMETVREIPRRTRSGEHGFDAFGIIAVDFKNDGGPVAVWHGPPAPAIADADHYANMIGRISALYASKFSAF